MNLHDWIDELCDVLDLETEVDEALLNDLAELAHRQVDRQAGPVTAYLVGYAAGAAAAGPAAVEKLASRAQELAERWDRPADAVDPEELAAIVDLPDDFGALDVDAPVDDEDEDDDGDDDGDDDTVQGAGVR